MVTHNPGDQMLDPHVPILKKALAVLQDDVARGKLTPHAANKSLGAMADALVHGDRVAELNAASKRSMRRRA